MYAGEVSVDALKAFGISIDTRHGKAGELAEMLNFCVAIEKKRLQNRVISLFYDSNSYCCTFELCPSVEEFDEVATEIRNTALATIGQFEWFGVINHGAPIDADLEE
ncbi:hypothetical protein [Pseudomonas rubra]|uniref:Uncharacterized protein n=1 Tax=Pseudomonas rubra TaxID=2942627 RepID=A0ABT5PFF2_9PSED|nr:hypothetical protein [Pseudomonas rubra]MDD1016862.1 hypothetical protein [Pseudomonas rubra]MDD1039392.1 hypothetical protein [Pseudomonas rubra]MDD1157826.1 hypothetical protein [Pseudomonas rubra]